MRAMERISPECILQLQEAIQDAGGNEVFAAGKVDEAGIVAELLVAARGNKNSVPALEGFIENADVLIHNHPSGQLSPSQADLAIASRVGQNGIGFFIVDNELENIYVVAEAIRKQPLIAIKPEQMASVLEPGGKLALLTGNYETRPSQIELVHSISDAMNNAYLLAAEAGTGVGKSFAYLVPALAWAARNNERVVISTATINLQRQLMDKDIPLVISIFKKELKAVLVKGRGNYLCLNRLQEAIEEEGLFLAGDNPLSAINEWSKVSPSGDKSDLSFWPDDALWARVCSESNTCLRLRCPHRESCFVLKTRKDAAGANMIVANHHILFSDIASRASGSGYEGTAVLPPYNMIIFDEAHNLEASATSFFSDEFTKYAVFKQLGRLYRERRSRKFGLITKLQNLKNLPQAVLDNFPGLSDELRSACEMVDLRAIALLGEESNWRMTEASSKNAEPLLDAIAMLEKAVMNISGLLQDALDAIPEESRGEQVVYEAGLALVSMNELAGVCLKWRCWEENPESIFWLEKGRTKDEDSFARLFITPLDIGSMMNESVYEAFRSVVCLSATLSVGGSFDFWKRRVGINRSRKESLCVEFPSPFPFSENALLAAPSDAPLPDNPQWQAWINKAVLKLIKASGGHALVLFTSYSSLRLAWDEVKPALDELGIAAFRQGDDERTRLLNNFKTDISSVLFATDSFWEGVDAPGDTLKLVIVCKLPFKVPTDPVQMARSEAIEKRGGNAFMELSLPEAVIRFKQGFGRLIRHSDDMGAVVVLDSRITKKRYGKTFLDSLPETRRVFSPLDETCKELEKFLKEDRVGGKK